MDRVTDEWLEVRQDEAEKLASIDGHQFVFDPTVAARAFAQSIARECREIADAWAGFPDASYRIAKGISTRFGLED